VSSSPSSNRGSNVEGARRRNPLEVHESKKKHCIVHAFQRGDLWDRWDRHPLVLGIRAKVLIGNVQSLPRGGEVKRRSVPRRSKKILYPEGERGR